MTIGDRIRKRRQELGWSQRELAQRAGLRYATIADLERGARRETSTDTIRRLARVLGVTTDYLVGMYQDEEEEEPTRCGVLAWA